jgi:F-type H+-transporting ATPase subunit b
LVKIVIVGGLLYAVSIPEGLAAGEAAAWRPTYDLIMRWVNFIILAAVLVKFGRRPLAGFLADKKEAVSHEINRLEKSKAELLQKVSEINQELTESQKRFEEIKSRIVQQGKRRRQEIIDEAHQESRILLASAKRKVDNRILQARLRLRSEMIDLAVSQALEKLPAIVNQEDDRKYVDRFLETVADR